MNEQAIRFRIGIFVLATLILLAVLITLFGGFPNYFKHTDQYTLVFTNAQGVAAGTPVRRSGVRIGEVRTITLDNVSGKVQVDIQVEDKYRLRKGDRPTVMPGFLGSDTSIAFLPPEDAKQIEGDMVDPGATLEGYSPVDAHTLVQKTGELMEPAQQAMVEVKKVFQKLDKLMPILDDTAKEFRELSRATRATIPELKKTNEEIQITARQWGKLGERLDLLVATNEDKINKTLARLEDTLKKVGDVFNDENQKNVRDTLKNLKTGSDRFDGIAKGTEEMIKDTRVTLKHVDDSLKRAEEVLENMQKATKPFADRSPAILKNVEESTDKLNKTLTDLREVFQAITRGDGSLQKLLSDPSLYNNVNDSAAMVAKILPRIDRVLRDFEIFADKIARHPESLGIGGVVRPSSGLKESPTIWPWRPGH